jgi:hypothetical protein
MPTPGIEPRGSSPLIAPNPGFPEKPTYQYERKMAPSVPGNRGPLRFEEGIATDTDVPNDFQRGMADGYITAPGRPNHNNVEVQWKHANETMAERAHVGSASWVEAPTYLSEFAHGSFSDYAEITYEEVIRSGGHYMRPNPAQVQD